MTGEHYLKKTTEERKVITFYRIGTHKELYGWTVYDIHSSKFPPLILPYWSCIIPAVGKTALVLPFFVMDTNKQAENATKATFFVFALLIKLIVGIFVFFFFRNKAKQAQKKLRSQYLLGEFYDQTEEQVLWKLHKAILFRINKFEIFKHFFVLLSNSLLKYVRSSFLTRWEWGSVYEQARQPRKFSLKVPHLLCSTLAKWRTNL